MTNLEAIECLSFHSARNPNIADTQWKYGFINSLRPYKRSLAEKNFHEIMKALYFLKESLQRDSIEKSFIADLWTIVYLGRDWGLSSNETLQQNQLTYSEEKKLLTKWIDLMDGAIWCLLDGCDVETAFELYFNTYPDKILEIK